MLRRLLAVLLVIAGTALTLAAPPAPPAAETYNVWVRYQIFAFRTERLRQYAEMAGVLKGLGFERDPDEVVADDEPENPKATRMQGTLPGKNVSRLLNHRHVRSLLLYPSGTKLPAKGTRVRVDMRLSTGYLPAIQKKLARQTAEVLTRDAGFIESVAYDHQNSNRIVGSVPVENLDRLLEDVRKLPSAADEPAPLANVSPVRLTFVRPDWPVPSGPVAFPAVPEKEIKFSPDLRLLLGTADAGKPMRFETILGYTPEVKDGNWQRSLERTGAVVEGRLGPVVSLRGIPREIAPKLAEMREVAHVRLPRQGRTAPPGPRDVPEKWEPVRASGLARIHALGKRGKGTRMAVVGDDFAGWEKLRDRTEGRMKLPNPVLFDLTAERNRDLLPDPFPTAKGEGYGTRCARALLRAAPEAELTLIRIDATCPYMLETIARAINGEMVRSICMEQRLTDLREDRVILDRRRDEVLDLRRRVFALPGEDDKEARDLRKEFDTRDAIYKNEDEAHRQRQKRYFQMVRDLQKLRAIRVVACTLTWTDGYPVDGSSALSRYIDDRPFKAALWFQAAGDTGGQAWAGSFRDQDDNGLMEFLGGKKPMLPAGGWTPELNFIDWRPATGAGTSGLPAGAKVRLTLQWREAHDTFPLRIGEDAYREPLAKFNLVVVHQPDPDGKRQPADDVQVVASSGGVSQRLDQRLNAGVYEQMVDLTVTRPGRYAVFVEGKLPDSTLAPGEARLPASKRIGEVRPRLLVRTLAGDGRAAWADYHTAQGGLGMPADARGVIAVGAADENDRARSTSASGPPINLMLLSKPEVLAYDEGGGTAQAASFAAGLAGSAWPMGGTLYGVMDTLRARPREVLRVPEPRGRLP